MSKIKRFLRRLTMIIAIGLFIALAVVVFPITLVIAAVAYQKVNIHLGGVVR